MRKIYLKSLKKYPKIRKKGLKSLAIKVLEIEKAPKNLEIGVTVVGDSYIKRLNKKYRNVDSPTDVLAFPIDVHSLLRASPHAKSLDVRANPRVRPEFLGDIYISLDRAQHQIPPGETIESEVSRLLIHGLLHLLGYKHSELMFTKQEYYLHKITKQTLKRGN